MSKQTPGPAQKRKEARDTCRFFYAMATDDGRETLKSRVYEDEGESIAVCEDLV